MLDENDLRAIAKLISDSESRMTARMTEEIAASEARMAEKLAASEARMTASMDEKLAASETRLKTYVDEKVSTAQSHTLALVEEKVSDVQNHTLALVEAYFDPKFQAMGEKIDLLEEKMVTFEDLEDIESRLNVLELLTRRNAREIEKLKKAQ